MKASSSTRPEGLRSSSESTLLRSSRGPLQRPRSGERRADGYAELAHVITIRDGRVSKLVEYFDRAEGLDAAGLTE